MTPLISAPVVFTLNGLKPGKKRVVSLTVCASGASGAGSDAERRARSEQRLVD